MKQPPPSQSQSTQFDFLGCELGNRNRSVAKAGRGNVGERGLAGMWAEQVKPHTVAKQARDTRKGCKGEGGAKPAWDQVQVHMLHMLHTLQAAVGSAHSWRKQRQRQLSVSQRRRHMTLS